ncbi:hypothetical protein [Streptomyces sp. Ag109_G2-15]|uniref:hypothetical protein n=1 Tax=Streptomyces sp. Ag109_G2-15 TaxID=1938850 RepID=UPI0015CEF678|nr:hypothetical protein [Streptomyces sp. Ag109_G2-15]
MAWLLTFSVVHVPRFSRCGTTEAAVLTPAVRPVKTTVCPADTVVGLAVTVIEA